MCVLLLIVSLARNKRRFADAILWKDNIYMHEAAEKLFGWYDLTTGECINPMEDLCKECRMTTTIAKGDGFIVISDSEFYIDMYKLKTGSEVTPQCCRYTKIGK